MPPQERNIPLRSFQLNKITALTSQNFDLRIQNPKLQMSHFNLVDPSRTYWHKSLISDGGSTKIQDLNEQKTIKKDQSSKIQLKNRVILNQIIIDPSAVSLTLATEQLNTNSNSSEQKCWVLKLPQFRQVQQDAGQPNSQQVNELKINFPKKKELKKSNAIKNFANKFVREFKNKTFDDLIAKYNIDSKGYKKMMDNLCKKVIYQKKSQKMQDLQSMITHSNQNFSQFLFEACEKFILMYPYKIKSSTRITDQQTNFKIIEKLQEMMDKLRIERGFTERKP